MIRFSWLVLGVFFICGRLQAANSHPQKNELQACQLDYPGCAFWPAFPISRSEFDAMNGSEPAGWKAAWEENELSLFPYSSSIAISALLELKALVLEDPKRVTSDWLPTVHPCDFSKVLCSRQGVVIGVDVASWDGGIVTSGVHEEEHANLVLRQLPDSQGWNQLGMMSLRIIRFKNVRVVDDRLPDSWGDFPYLREISLSGCGFKGQLPTAWSHALALERLDLSDNAFTGTLPVEWSQLTTLRSLDLSLFNPTQKAKLSGSLPSSWEAIVRLRILDLSNQDISGSLPPSWGTLPSLEILSLSGTKLSGSLPETWTSMRNLTTLHLAGTAVSGKLPSSWGSMQNLTWIDLRGTQISTGVPRSWKSFCQGLRGASQLPFFAYFPWDGLTEMNSLRSSDSNLCIAWQRRRSNVQLGAFLLCAVLSLGMLAYVMRARRRKLLPTFKSKSNRRGLHQS